MVLHFRRPRQERQAQRLRRPRSGAATKRVAYPEEQSWPVGAGPGSGTTRDSDRVCRVRPCLMIQALSQYA